ncbi:calcium-binding protein [Enterovibrio coralii]|uniref:RTX toxin n=1 Tax=Enterovibrio coralii TaxID=294935 RepID=A0A135I3F7_9GAMM|nr:calcium-binding protein [Enterovibrio coralii]KXF79973.1 RTX toxin [Enterovibrio coralii]
MATITGSSSQDDLAGTSDNDTLYGLGDNDILRGYGGDDRAYGDSSADDITSLTANTDGSYDITENTFLTVTLSQFDFDVTEEQSLGYAILDSSGNVVSREIVVDAVTTAERGSAIDINVPDGAKLVFFTIPATDLPSFEWTPFNLADVNTDISSDDVAINVEEIASGDTSTHGNDSLFGYDGDDYLIGEGGDDALTGGNGNDVISGGDGNDRAWGGNDNDHLHGGDGDDKLYGQNGDDKLEGGDGDDELWGGFDNDELHGGAGDDLLEGQQGDDELRGGAGNDDIFGEEGVDKIYGDGGNDYIEAGDGNDLVFGGTGDDEIYGDDGDDDLRGNAGDDEIYGGEGDDKLYGKQGNDTLYGGVGNDELYGNVGSNQLYGGDGDDLLVAGWFSADNILDGQGGVDSLTGSINSDTLIFDANDFQGQTKTLPGGTQINEHRYDASSGFDTMKIVGEQHADFTGATYQSDPSITGNVIAGVEAVIGDSSAQTVTINLHEIDEQSDDTNNADWQGFVAWLGDGDDTLNFTGINWEYNASATPAATITPDMIAKMGLTAGQVSDLQAYVFDDMYSDAQITIWTDADNIDYLGTTIL